MCAVKNYLSSYHKVNENTVRMANNTVNKIVGMGTVRFRRHDGKVLTLTRVQLVPGLKKNLFLLGC